MNPVIENLLRVTAGRKIDYILPPSHKGQLIELSRLHLQFTLNKNARNRQKVGQNTFSELMGFSSTRSYREYLYRDTLDRLVAVSNWILEQNTIDLKDLYEAEVYKLWVSSLDKEVGRPIDISEKCGGDEAFLLEECRVKYGASINSWSKKLGLSANTYLTKIEYNEVADYLNIGKALADIPNMNQATLVDNELIQVEEEMIEKISDRLYSNYINKNQVDDEVSLD